LDNPTVACLGLSYKADIDDLRESPAVDITRAIAWQIDGTVLCVEPHIDELPESLNDMKNLRLTDQETAYEAADIIVLLTDHAMFRDLSPAYREGQQIIDTRGAWRE
jgi:UDP-N-acetyl-D-mannosaminuronic acid dehydrogenase